MQRKWPTNWKQIQRAIKLRADHRCECGSFWDCDSNAHHHRCPNREGNRYPHNKRLIGLRIVQLRGPDDFRPESLIALCLPCYTIYEQRLVAATPRPADEEAGLF